MAEQQASAWRRDGKTAAPRADAAPTPVTSPAPSGAVARREALVDQADEALAQHAGDGCRESFSILVERFEGRLVRFLIRGGASPPDAEEAAQEAFVRAWRSIRRFDPTYRFSTWLFTIGRRVAMEQKRGASRRAAMRERVGRERERRDDQAEAARALIVDREAREAPGDENAVWGVARRALKDEQFEALWLRYVMDMDMGDVARVLGRTRVGTRVLLFRARGRLHEAMTAHAGGEAS